MHTKSLMYTKYFIIMTIIIIIIQSKRFMHAWTMQTMWFRFLFLLHDSAVWKMKAQCSLPVFFESGYGEKDGTLECAQGNMHLLSFDQYFLSNNVPDTVLREENTVMSKRCRVHATMQRSFIKGGAWIL